MAYENLGGLERQVLDLLADSGRFTIGGADRTLRIAQSFGVDPPELGRAISNLVGEGFAEREQVGNQAFEIRVTPLGRIEHQKFEASRNKNNSAKVDQPPELPPTPSVVRKPWWKLW